MRFASSVAAAALLVVCESLGLLDARCEDTTATITNKGFERTLSWSDGVLRTTSVANRLSGRRYELKSDEFTLILDERPVTIKKRNLIATASSVQRADKYPAPNAVDGDLSTAWTSAKKPGDGHNEWLEVDLNEELPLCGLCIVWYAPWKVLQYNVEIPEGNTWRAITAHTDDQEGDDSAGACQTYDRFEPVKARKFRIVVNSVKTGSGNTAIYEVMPLIQGDPMPSLPQRMTSRDFVVRGHEGGLFKLESRDGRLAVDVNYGMPPDSDLMRKTLTVRPITNAAPLVSAIEVEAFRLPEKGLTKRGGIGKPVFMGDVWLGIEHPAGHANASAGKVALRCHPGRKLAPEGITSKTAVWGAARSEEGVPDAFLDYVFTIRHDAPAPLRHHIVEELFMTNIPKTEAGYREFVADATDRLWKQHGIFLDALTFWWYYESRTGYFDGRKKDFPQGFAPVAKQLAETGARGANALGAGVEGPTQIGAWFSLWGQESLDGEWGKAQGYEMASLDPKWGAYCFIAPRSHQLITNRIKELTHEYKLAFMHWDFNRFSCAAPDGLDHGHIPNHPSYWERAIDAEIELARDLRKEVPYLFLMMGCGSYPSPWLLSFYDVVFNGGGDTGLADVPALVPKDDEITFRDIALHGLLTDERNAGTFPTWGVWTHEPLLNHGDPASGIASRQKPPVPLVEKWDDNLVMEMMRGTRIWKMHYEPKLLDEAKDGWKFLADAMRWQRANKDLALRTRWIGGDPAKREPYGYYHPANAGTRGRAWAGLRNPFIEPREIALAVDQDFGSARVIYPFKQVICGALKKGEKLEVRLGPYEAVVVELSPERAEPIKYDRFAALAPAKAEISGSSLRGEFTMPPTGGRLVVLLDAPWPKTAKAAATVNGKPVDVVARGWRMYWDSAKSRNVVEDGNWRFFTIPLPGGASRVEFKLEGASGHLQAWQQADFDRPCEPAKEGDLPSSPTRATVETVTARVL
jgi:hypothetical protein